MKINKFKETTQSRARISLESLVHAYQLSVQPFNIFQKKKENFPISKFPNYPTSQILITQIKQKKKKKDGKENLILHNPKTKEKHKEAEKAEKDDQSLAYFGPQSNCLSCALMLGLR